MTTQAAGQKVLVTGFEPFGKADVNPSALLAQQLDSQRIEGTPVVGVVLPVSHRRAAQQFSDAVEGFTPTIVISLGLAGGRSKLGIERVGINVLDYPMPDNDGEQPTEGQIVSDGPDAYLSTLPVKAIAAAWTETGIPGYVSNTAGTFLCNEILYTSLHLATRHGYRAGFIHVPCVPEQAAIGDPTSASMSLDVMARGITRAIEIAIGQTTRVAALATAL